MRDLINLVEASQGTPNVRRPELDQAFWRWFGQSKAVDDSGQPLVVWHGVKNADMYLDYANKEVVFLPEFEVFNTDHRTEPGIYFSPSRQVAEHYGTPCPFYLKVDTPICMEEPVKQQPEGHDSIYRMRSSLTGLSRAWEIAVFRPEQIKSVYNEGTWSPHDPRFMK